MHGLYCYSHIELELLPRQENQQHIAYIVHPQIYELERGCVAVAIFMTQISLSVRLVFHHSYCIDLPRSKLLFTLIIDSIYNQSILYRINISHHLVIIMIQYYLQALLTERL